MRREQFWINERVVPADAVRRAVESASGLVILSDTEHEGILNSKALAMEGLTAETQASEGGEIGKDENGKLTGWLMENAAGTWAWKHYPQISPEDRSMCL